MRERDFQSELIKTLKERFSGSIVLKNDTQHIQGFPDLTVLYKDTFAVLECKRSEKDPYQSNQEYYIQKIVNWGGFATTVHPQNVKDVLHELNVFFNLRDFRSDDI